MTPMLFPLLLLQASSLVAPLYLQDEPPELRAARAILVLHAEVQGVPPSLRRSREEAAELAASLRARLAGGADFAELARLHSGHESAVYGGVLGSFWPGMLRGEADRFLFSAAPGELSPPLDTEIGFQILQRIDERAGCLHILLKGEDQPARAADLMRRLAEGADFRELASAFSDDPLGRERAGAQAVFLRGPTDSLLKEAIFQAAVGEVVGPLQSVVGTSIGKRVPPEEIPPELTDDLIARVRSILIQNLPERDMDLSEAFANELAARIRSGEDMGELASLYDDDPGGRERAGDLGWILRRASKLQPIVERVYSNPVGELVGPLKLRHGWLLLRRER